MNLTEHVVSYSLEVNTRCLKFLAECRVPGADTRAGSDLAPAPPKAAGAQDSCSPNTVYTESVLARDSRRLTSLWHLAMPAAAPTTFEEIRRHYKELRGAAHELSLAPANRALALRLANLATEEADAATMQVLAQRMPAPPELPWIDLCAVFARDSALWRDPQAFQVLPNSHLLDRLTRVYRKGHRIVGLLLKAPDGAMHQRKDLIKLERLVRLTYHQMELLRAGLSEKGRSQLWFLEKLSEAVRMRLHMEHLLQALEDDPDGGSLDVGSTRLYVASHRERMNRRIEKLGQGAFGPKPKRMRARLDAAVAHLSIADVDATEERVA